MKVTESQVTKMVIIGAERLDPVTAIFEDTGDASGKFIIECYGESWSHYWGNMGPSKSVRDFFLSCSCEYLANKCVSHTREIDFDAISAQIERQVDSWDELRDQEELMIDHYGDDWNLVLPVRDTQEYTYFSRIAQAVKDAIVHLKEQSK